MIEYVGIPYADKGRTREGADCWGLLRIFYADQFGIDLPSHTDRYAHSDSRLETAALASAEIADHWRAVTEPKFGDAVVLNILRRPFHVGVYLGGNKFLHNLGASQGAVIERLNAPAWARRIEGFYRHVERL